MLVNLNKCYKNYKFILVYKKLMFISNYFIKYNFFSKAIRLINNIMFIKNTYLIMINSYFYIYLFNKIEKNILLIFCSFVYSKVFIKVGLGFRKKYYKKFNTFVLNVGRRYLILFKSMFSTYFFNIRRRSIYMFSNNKRNLYYYLSRLRILRRETIYKYKGILTSNRLIFDSKIARSVVFARRIKFKNIRLKLTRKQKQRK